MSWATQERVYLDAQAACGLCVGDWVKVIRAAENYEAGWPNCWVNDDVIKAGGTFKIVEFSLSRGVVVDCGKFGLRSFPYFVLVRAEKPVHEFKPFDRVLARDRDAEKWFPDIFLCMPPPQHPSGNFYICAKGNWSHCIPYEGNEYLVGTTEAAE